MTLGTICSQSTVMRFLIAMTVGTPDRRILIKLGLVTIVTFCLGVLALQRKLRQRVIEFRVRFPITLAMAAQTVFAQLTFVNVALQVTRNACCCGPNLVRILLMALLARHTLVLPKQREFRVLVMIKPNITPGGRLMTRITLGPIPTLVDIARAVTVSTPHRQTLVALTGVARTTTCLDMGAGQRKLGRFMIERLGLVPYFRSVAAATLRAELTLVGINRAVTIDTGTLRLSEFFACLMAAITRHGPVLTNKRKIGQSVIKRRRIELHNIGLAALVIGMTMTTIVGCNILAQAMHTAMIINISSH
jgi:hypothetical protein